MLLGVRGQGEGGLVGWGVGVGGEGWVGGGGGGWGGGWVGGGLRLCNLYVMRRQCLLANLSSMAIPVFFLL